MSIVNLEDVKDILNSLAGGYDDSQDARLQDIIDSTEDFISRVYGIKDFTCVTSYTERFFGYKDGSILNLSDSNPSNVTISFVDYNSDQFITMPPPRFTVMDNGRVWLQFPSFIAPFEGATARNLPSEIRQINITYTPSQGKPSPALAEAIALSAAFALKMQDSDFSGLQSETIGSYSYNRFGKLLWLTLPPKARALLRPFSRRTFIQVT